MQPTTKDGNGLVLFCKKCKGHRNLFSKYCNKCNNEATEKHIGQMELAGWKVKINKDGKRVLV